MLRSHVSRSFCRTQHSSFCRVQDYYGRTIPACSTKLKALYRGVTCNVIAYATEASISVVATSAVDDAVLTEKCINSLSNALEPDISTHYWCYPWLAAQFYMATLSLAMREDPGSRNLFSVKDGACAAICNLYPRQNKAGNTAESMDSPFKPSRPWWRDGLSLQLKTWLSVRPNRWIEAYIVGEVLERLRARFAAEHGPFLHLLVIGTRPNQQRMGLGRQLLNYICSHADQQGLWVYVEATSPSSKRLFEINGFMTLQTLQHISTAPKTFTMARAPRLNR
ncbi:hypothetical protein CEUSTIGMA_g4698.t1 [Chlamydomonas eustigma]|uniref:N-acetyltransferase domain-containing protein n=1 Tax=Chlamydomonas eustigma TaxID=1157962 RepID=A0A250X2X8_9CHLO|nr:hypothetical protein CEUSTIGMA_g4698.t1 [Chlamydomonas eustigma]|eukprot:GAX77252.1 hypothetical protein CEUSTIGMA_g4698.t1 [Chlamydomonas eustigma]